LLSIGFNKGQNSYCVPNQRKETIRLIHSEQRKGKLLKAKRFLEKNFELLIHYFASGNEIVPDKIFPRIEMVMGGSIQAKLFRLASLTWSVPVSEGYGRRMRFIVWDESIGKLIGIFALGDPVFNLQVRDRAFGWNANDRKERLVNIMDAYVLGAVPPYNLLLCG
jgi:hypothetical protein